MSRVVTVEVTAEDIANGKRGNECACPIALACRRALPGDEVIVGNLYVHAGAMELRMPREASAFVLDFDYRRPVAPFTFTVELP